MTPSAANAVAGVEVSDTHARAGALESPDEFIDAHRVAGRRRVSRRARFRVCTW